MFNFFRDFGLYVEAQLDAERSARLAHDLLLADIGKTARAVAHKHTPRCTGGRGDGYGDGARYHSKACDVLAEAIADAIYDRCEGRGFEWRVPDGFNPFSAGGFRTANATRLSRARGDGGQDA